ncbi:fibronectin type III domain-containing protein [Myxococcus xanthus]|uniref:Fibronectin type III domain-containing protein n=1 Tax=Myxococcus xanthus TaxID=34 RepID=A0A7Y4IFW2_MYXXA|nr:fibronectin type III domain-containing protein [Myxococcus xanthus]NOJ85604.1 fibronectin type III domain-containing protein [Myxococcus xanthus]
MNGRIRLVAAVWLGVVLGWGCGGSDAQPPVQGPHATLPRAPSLVIAVPGDGQVTVTWDVPGDGGSALLDYAVHVYSDEGEVRVVTVPVSEPRAVVTELANGTAYAFSVVARNARGRSVASERSDRVVPHVTPGAVQNLVAVESDQTVTLSWDAADDKGMPLDSYFVTPFFEAREGETVRVPATELGKTFHSMTNGMAVRFVVVAYNGHARGPEASIEATPFTTPGVPVLTAEPNAGGGRVFLTWRVDDTGGNPITSYRVTVYLEGEVIRTVETFETRASVESLVNATTYQFTVEAANAAGWGQASERIAAMPTRYPSKPRNATCQGGHGWISFGWEPPEFDYGHPVTGYRLSTVIDGDSADWYTTDPGYHLTTIPNDGRAFSFFIAAGSAAGFGEAARLQCSTWPDRP